MTTQSTQAVAAKINNDIPKHAPSAVVHVLDEAANTTVGAAFGKQPDLTALVGNCLGDEAADGADYLGKRIKSQHSGSSIHKTSTPTQASDKDQAPQTAARFNPDFNSGDADDGIEDLYTEYKNGLSGDISAMAQSDYASARSMDQREVQEHRATHLQRRATRVSSSVGFFARAEHYSVNTAEFMCGLGIGAVKEVGSITYSTAEAFDHPIRTGLLMYAVGQAFDHTSMHFMSELWNAQTRPEALAQLKDGIGSAGVALSTKYKELSKLTPIASGETLSEGAVDAGSYLVPGVDEVRGVELAGDAAQFARPAFSEDYGVALFGKDNLKYYIPDSLNKIPNLGAKGRPFFMMPGSDASKINSVVRAAIETGFSPSTFKAWKEDGDIFGITFPTKGIDARAPTKADAMGWRHFLEGGHTAINAEGTNSFIVNTTREFVIPGGNTMPKGSVLFRLDNENGSWLPIWRY